MKCYGIELMLDLHDCRELPVDRPRLDYFFKELCTILQMQMGDSYFWDYAGFPKEYAGAPPKIKGTSAIQFISSSNITVHTLDDLKQVYINIFTCEDCDMNAAMDYCALFFAGRIVRHTVLDRL